MLRKSILAAAIFALSASQSFAASRVSITEFATLAATASGGSSAQIATLPALAKQSIDISDLAAHTSTSFNAGTYYIRVACEVQCAIDGVTTATGSALLMFGNSVEYFGVQPGKTISVIAAP